VTGSLLTESVVEMLMKESNRIFIFLVQLILFLLANSIHIMNCSSLSTFMTAGHVTALPHDCSGSTAILSTMCWLWISTFSCSCLYATDCLSTDTPMVPQAPATINLQIGDQNKQKHFTIHVYLLLKYLQYLPRL